MSEKLVYVHIELLGKTHLVGRLWVHSRKGRESASFEYDQDWLQHRERFALEPALSLTSGTFHTEANKSMFDSLGDSAPDRWGRILIRRAAKQRAKKDRIPYQTLNEIDYLLAVNDWTRQGALRFSLEKEGSFLSDDPLQKVPPLIDLPESVMLGV